MIKASEETEHFTFLEIFKSLPAFFSILYNYIDSLRLIVSLNASTLPASKCNLQTQDSEQSLNNIYSVCSQCFTVAFGGKQRNRMYDFCSQSS